MEATSPCVSGSKRIKEMVPRDPDTTRIENKPGSAQNLNPLHGFPSFDSTVQGSENWKKSSAPARILFCRENTWNDFSPQVFAVLKASFITGKKTVTFLVEGDPSLVDFSHMVQVMIISGSMNPIGWIDVDGQCFFPTVTVDVRKNPLIKIEQRSEEPHDSCSVAPPRELRTPNKRYLSGSTVELFDESSGESSSWPNVVLLSTDDRFYKFVERLFYVGMRRLAPNCVIRSIYKCSYTSRKQSFRLKAFRMQLEITKAVRENADVRFAWFGTSAEGVATVVEHGFGLHNNGCLGPNACGVGIHLSPTHCPYDSSLLAEADDKGEGYMILCRVIVGNVEEVPAGSRQFHPSTSEFDSGVDNVENPKWMIIWEIHMNTRILPEYIVRFMSSKQPQAKKRPVQATSFPRLFAEIGRSLHPSKIQALENLYKHHKEGKISKDIFIRHLRSIAGDELLSSTIKRIRGHL